MKRAGQQAEAAELLHEVRSSVANEHIRVHVINMRSACSMKTRQCKHEKLFSISQQTYDTYAHTQTHTPMAI